MSYQVLARKYRPSNFQELEGQEHVLRALVNALDNDRLHHAYLFTGTRGVGKTTIARILAKCLNCEAGVSSTPCGQCGSCTEIAEGRSIDLIEYDAASRTKVEDTREILDNVQYMPTKSRFKVYLIDEVHMLSNHSFNALLKTLEEPPEHVKFLLATTDPKKLPVTVLSRCLQFNLKNITPERVVNYLEIILKKEDVKYDDAALWQLGRAADGSMRDALSLTDQAISFGNNTVSDADVKTMLGSFDQEEIYDLISCLVEKNAKGLLTKISKLAEFAPDYSALLAEFLSVLHRVAVAQAVPDGTDNSQGDQKLVMSVAETMSREDLQLYYQIALIGQRDLPYSPEPRTGFEMIMLRMLAFTPNAQASHPDVDPAVSADASAKKKTVKIAEPEKETKKETEEKAPQKVEKVLDKKAVGIEAGAEPAIPEGMWFELLKKLNLSGVTQSLAANCVVSSFDESHCELLLNQHHASLWNSNHETRIAAAMSDYYGREINIEVTKGETLTETPAETEVRLKKIAQENAVELIENDDKVQQLIERFGGQLERDTIVARQKTGE